MAYDSAIITFTTKTDKVDLVQAAHMNAVQSELVTIETILGTNVKGDRTDLKTRLNNALDADGSILSGTAYPSPALASQMFYRTDLNSMYVFDGGWNEVGAEISHAAGTYVEGTATTERNTNSTNYVKLKEFSPMIRAGVVTVAWQMKIGAYTAYGKVYLNGVATGTEKSTSSATYADLTDDITVAKDDVVQIYVKSGNAGANAYIANAYIKTAKPTLPGEASGY